MDALALQADRDAVVTALFHAHWSSLVRLARLLVDDTETAEDVVQEAFLADPPALGSLRDPERALHYLRASVANGARNQLRRRRVRRGHLVDNRCPSPRPRRWRWAGRSIERCAGPPRFSWRQRQVLVLRYYLDLSEAQIAETLSISAGAVKSHASRGIATLSSRMEASS